MTTVWMTHQKTAGRKGILGCVLQVGELKEMYYKMHASALNDSQKARSICVHEGWIKNDGLGLS
jgi:hypothetical protein